MRTNTMMIDGHRVMHTSTNRKAAYFWKDYERATETTVLQAYRTKPSEEKQAVEMSIRLRMVEQRGKGYKVMSHNTFSFSCGYLIPTEYGEILRVETKANTYYVINDGDYISK